MSYYIYDLETYPNIFTFCGKFEDSTDVNIFEISDRINERDALLNFLGYLRNCGAEMVGFNNVGFDYPILHELITNPYTFNHVKASQTASVIISSQGKPGRGYKYIMPSERYIAQIDVFKLCHFDNAAKATSLKALQFAMRSHSLEDLPFDIRPLDNQEKDVLRDYNVHDVIETEKFFKKNKHHIDMRRDYLAGGTLRGDVLNYSDVKIGIEYLKTRLGSNTCFQGGKPKRTLRESIDFKNIHINLINPFKHE